MCIWLNALRNLHAVFSRSSHLKTEHRAEEHLKGKKINVAGVEAFLEIFLLTESKQIRKQAIGSLSVMGVKCGQIWVGRVALPFRRFFLT